MASVSDSNTYSSRGVGVQDHRYIYYSNVTDVGIKTWLLPEKIDKNQNILKLCKRKPYLKKQCHFLQRWCMIYTARNILLDFCKLCDIFHESITSTFFIDKRKINW